MKTFRQFLEDINVIHGDEYSPEESAETARNMQASLERKPAGYKRLPVDFPIKGFEVRWVKNEGDTFVCLVDTRKLDIPQMPFGIKLDAFLQKGERLAVVLEVSPRTFPLPGRKLRGLQTDTLSSNPYYRGSGLAPMLYETLARAGQVLFSSSAQTPGGQKTWRRLTSSVADVCGVAMLVHDVDAHGLLKRFGGIKHNLDIITSARKGDAPLTSTNLEKMGEYWLAFGPTKVLDDLLYEDGEFDDAIWVLAPHDVLAAHEKTAIHVDRKLVPPPEGLIDQGLQSHRFRAWR